MPRLTTNASPVHERPLENAVDLVGFVERLEERLPWLLPGDVTVDAVVPNEPTLAAVPCDALEEIVAELLTLGLPPRSWRYTVRVEIVPSLDAELVLGLELHDARLRPLPVPTSLEARIDDLAIRVGQDRNGRLNLALPAGPSPFCGRHEWVQRLTEAGIPARCIDPGCCTSVAD